jgi:hypothetical protein
MASGLRVSKVKPSGQSNGFKIELTNIPKLPLGYLVRFVIDHGTPEAFPKRSADGFINIPVVKEGQRASFCAGCKVYEPVPRQFRLCSGCNTVRYCSTECQQGHWRNHRATCRLARSEDPDVVSIMRLAKRMTRSEDQNMVLNLAMVEQLCPPGAIIRIKIERQTTSIEQAFGRAVITLVYGTDPEEPEPSMTISMVSAKEPVPADNLVRFEIVSGDHVLRHEMPSSQPVPFTQTTFLLKNPQFGDEFYINTYKDYSQQFRDIFAELCNGLDSTGHVGFGLPVINDKVVWTIVFMAAIRHAIQCHHVLAPGVFRDMILDNFVHFGDMVRRLFLRPRHIDGKDDVMVLLEVVVTSLKNMQGPADGATTLAGLSAATLPEVTAQEVLACFDASADTVKDDRERNHVCRPLIEALVKEFYS